MLTVLQHQLAHPDLTGGEWGKSGPSVSDRSIMGENQVQHYRTGGEWEKSRSVSIGQGG
jgi:hypothetical protein